MTVCVAAIAEGHNSIVFAMDQMLTAGVISVDAPELAKGMRVHEYWLATYAGDADFVAPILGDATDTLSTVERPSAEQVADAFVRAYAKERQRITEQSVLAQYGLDWRSFHAMLADINVDTEPIREELKKVQFDVHLLIGGFDANPSARLLAITPPGVEGRYDYIGFWAIGGGSEAAVNNLLLREYKAFQDLQDSIYQVAESKFVAESIQGIGRGTAIAVLRNDGSIATVTRGKADQIRQMWQDEGRPQMPQKLDNILSLLHFRKIPMPPPSRKG